MTTILVIEDQEGILENIRELLEAEGFETLGATNGIVGLQLARQKKPDLILCDIMMPKLDGYGVLRALRQDPKMETTPFIFLTAKAEKVDLRQGMTRGADDYLTKPCQPEEMLAAIAARLDKQAAIARQSEARLANLRANIAQSLPHELRTPLNSILGFSEVLMNKSAKFHPEDIQQMGESINHAGKRLSRQIENFLLSAQLDLIASDPQQVQALRNERIHSADAALADCIMYQALKADRQADLQLKLHNTTVAISAIKLQKLVRELVDNALKFSPAGTPVEVAFKSEGDRAIFSVSDKGRGMSAEQIAQVGAYMQFERKLHEQQGSGLGLAIAKRIAELHGGTLTIYSDPSVSYTTVRVVLPKPAGEG